MKENDVTAKRLVELESHLARLAHAYDDLARALTEVTPVVRVVAATDAEARAQEV